MGLQLLLMYNDMERRGKNLINCLFAIIQGLHRKAVLYVLEPDMRAT